MRKYRPGDKEAPAVDVSAAHYSAELSGISGDRSSLRGTFLRTEMRRPLLDATPIRAGG